MPDGAKVNCDVAVVGAGPAGLTAAIALASAGLDTILVAGSLPSDNRTTALLSSSVTALETLGVWDACHEQAAPLETLRIVDDTNRLLRAPEARFDAREIGLPAFAYNIENTHLIAALVRRCDLLAGLRRIEEDAEAVGVEPAQIRIRTRRGKEIAAPLVVAADGARSICRAAAGIETAGWTYPQVALTFTLSHTRPHNHTSTEFHTELGPFTTVPLPGLRSSIVCVVDPATADELRGLPERALDEEIERRSHSILGKVTVEPGYGAFPLAAETAKTFGASRVALVGEAAHRIPPIGAQGLNLGLRDAAAIAELAVEAKRRGDDTGADEVLRRYDNMRRPDVTSRTFAVDLLNRSLLSSLLPMQGLRGLGLYMLNSVGPVRRMVMREGVAPAAALPRLMRGETLV